MGGDVAVGILAGDPGNVAIRADSTIYYYSIFGNAAGWIMSIILALLGFGLWGLKEWGRKGSVVFAIFSIVWGLLNVGGYLVFVAPRMAQIMSASAGQQVPPEFIKWYSMAIVPGCACILLCFYIFVAIYLTRPKVKAAFQRMD